MSERDNIRFGKYKHFKNGQSYELIGIVTHSETLDEMVLYKALYHSEKFGDNALWVRPKAMFFEQLMHEGKLVNRFEYIG
jgi:hypothetical protein